MKTWNERREGTLAACIVICYTHPTSATQPDMCAKDRGYTTSSAAASCKRAVAKTPEQQVSGQLCLRCTHRPVCGVLDVRAHLAQRRHERASSGAARLHQQRLQHELQHELERRAAARILSSLLRLQHSAARRQQVGTRCGQQLWQAVSRMQRPAAGTFEKRIVWRLLDGDCT